MVCLLYNSNTTLVKVKFFCIVIKIIRKTYSNTTLVKVKLEYRHAEDLTIANSNTTLVKVKFNKEFRETFKHIFKYNSC